MRGITNSAAIAPLFGGSNVEKSEVTEQKDSLLENIGESYLAQCSLLWHMANDVRIGKGGGHIGLDSCKAHLYVGDGCCYSESTCTPCL